MKFIPSFIKIRLTHVKKIVTDCAKFVTERSVFLFSGSLFPKSLQPNQPEWLHLLIVYNFQ